MGLNDRLKKVKAIGEERKLTLRIPESKAKILELLAEHYGTNISTIIREMIDDSIMKLQKDLIVLPDELGVKVTIDGKKRLVTYFPDIVAIYTNDTFPYAIRKEDCSCSEEFTDATVKEDARLSVEKGMAESHFGVTPYSNEEFNFNREGK